ncbi:hypothetical protein GGTG_14071 [Gaeumannomyces tritici R3-111a-1]|uniref:Uncharacterized protein n=1 Tax=Gaeumannomyces tritici (strain R3-111a-1) TaxID=644352 RepID=J3PKL1_GAET3|nr:hypothetical protein GGTG_14071 [Gaeumannomyces tritici R3-111a-1]EJT68350.1 hypothetical protein GGTG_14071 [Gaeumannomyces tritici R3-111a-1]
MERLSVVVSKTGSSGDGGYAAEAHTQSASRALSVGPEKLDLSPRILPADASSARLERPAHFKRAVVSGRALRSGPGPGSGQGPSLASALERRVDPFISPEGVLRWCYVLFIVILGVGIPSPSFPKMYMSCPAGLPSRFAPARQLDEGRPSQPDPRTTAVAVSRHDSGVPDMLPRSMANPRASLSAFVAPPSGSFMSWNSGLSFS